MKLGRIILFCACLAVTACGRSTPVPAPATATAALVATGTPYPAPPTPAPMTATPYPLPAATATQPRPTLPPAPSGPRLNQILDFWFVDELNGWLTASICDSSGSCKLGMRKTINGGHDWSAIPAPDAPISFFGTDQAGGSHSVRFLSDQVGWVYGPALYSTTDGGKTWQEQKLPGNVVDIEPLGSMNAWALVSECDSGGDCRLKIYQSQGSGWSELGAQPGLVGQSGSLLRIATNRDASGQVHQGGHYQYDWVLGQSGVGQDESPTWTISYSENGGADWTDFQIPCAKNPDLLQAAEPQMLWLICTSGPGAGSQLKKLYLSTDGGQTWTAKPDPPSTGYADGLAALSDRRAFFGLGRGTLLGTVDGGASWNQALPIETANPGGSSGWVVRFYQNANGWASVGNGFFRTTDAGRDWEMIEPR